MNVSRFVSRVSKPFLASFCPRLAPVLWAPCRTITTGRDHVTFGKVGGKMKASPTRDFDKFVGRWVQQSETVTSEEGTRVDYRCPVKFKDHNYQQYVTFSRTGQIFRMEVGFLDMDLRLHYIFQFGVDLLVACPDNNCYRIIVYQRGDHMNWTFQPINSDPYNPTQVDHPIHQTTKLEDNKLVVKTEYPDNTVTMKTFIKDETMSCAAMDQNVTC